jgi:hypothetical protein
MGFVISKRISHSPKGIDPNCQGRSGHAGFSCDSFIGFLVLGLRGKVRDIVPSRALQHDLFVANKYAVAKLITGWRGGSWF